MFSETSILVVNSGSSSLKFGLFRPAPAGPVRWLSGELDDDPSPTGLEVRDASGRVLADIEPAGPGQAAAIEALLEWIGTAFPGQGLLACGHRLVHGGRAFTGPVRVDAGVLEALRALVPLAPLHMPRGIEAIECVARRRPDLPQVACFDTAFHHAMPWCERVCALPRVWFERGVQRYGFHGLSYDYIASVLPAWLGRERTGRVVVAHLGHGASLCAIHDGRSVATTMGFTPLDGVPMATRPGSLDPGIAPWMQREHGLDAEAIDELFNHESGLKGLSGTTGDMRILLDDPRPEARQAIDFFVHHVHRAIASLAAAMGGLDVLVFTAGIGENAPMIREHICRAAAWLGIEIDVEANAANRPRLSTMRSRVAVWRIPTDEAIVIARQTLATIAPPDDRERPNTSTQ